MSTRRAVAAVTLVAALVAAAAPAQARETTVTDPAGDAYGRGLDITSAQIRNRDSAVVTTVTFVEDVRGDVIVSLEARRGSGVRVVHEHRTDRKDRTFVLPGSFTVAASGPVCKGVSGDWHPRARSVTLRLPSRCLDDGDYGAVRAAVLTEGRQGDTDLAPESSRGMPAATAWIPRG